jgi:hypothetical protein
MKTNDLAASIATWNALVEEIETLLAGLRTVHHTRTVMNVACAVWNSSAWRQTDMIWALGDPLPNRPHEADEHCRELQKAATRLRTAIERDAPRAGCRGCFALDTAIPHLPDNLTDIQRRYRAGGLGAFR